MNGFSIKDKVVVLRFSRLGRIPPAQSAVQILSENLIPLEVVEFGADNDDNEWIAGPPAKRRIRTFPLPWLRGGLRTLFDVSATFLQLLLWIAREGRPRLFFAHGLYEQWVANLVFRLLNIPYAVAVHEVYEPDDLSLLNRLFLSGEKQALKEADFLIFPEESRAEYYTKRYGLKNQQFVVYNCPRLRKTEMASLRSTWAVPSDSMVLGYLGGIGRDNYLRETIQAVLDLPQVSFYYWGWGDQAYLAELEKLAEPASKRIRWMGVAGEEKWAILKGWDLGLCLYRPDLLRLKMAATASNKMFECLSVGVPVLTTNAPDFKKFLAANPVGYSVTDVSVPGIRRGIETALSQSSDLQAKGAMGRARYRDAFHFEAQFAPVLAAFKERFAKGVNT